VSILLVTLAYGTTEMLQSQLLRWGESLFTGYHELRADAVKPSCDVAQYKAQLSALQGSKTASETKDELDDLLDDDSKVAPAAPIKPAEDELDDLLDDTPSPVPAPKKSDELDSLLDDPAPEADTENSELDALLAAPNAGKKIGRASVAEIGALNNAIQNCEAALAKYQSVTDRTTGGVRIYRALEGNVAGAIKFSVSYIKHALVLLLMLCAVCTTYLKHHIALRPARSKLDHLVSEGFQFAVNLTLTFSAWVFHTQQSSAPGEYDWLPALWMLGFLGLALVNLRHLYVAQRLPSDDASIGRAALTIPLYTIMGLIAGLYFLVFSESKHAAGLLISASQLAEYPILYLQVGLYVWVGMLLKRTQLASMSFDIVRPWKLPPEILAFVAVVGAALPTAYSGASGIFVIAVGAIIYDELKKAGARTQLALAATAMSGSMGVVLRPCLLVVVVASVNKEVTTGPLYSWGVKVFLLTAVLFLIASLINREGPLTCASPKEALPASIRAFKPLLGYLTVFVGLVLFYRYVLDKRLDETSAPIVLPVIMLGMLLFDQFRGRKHTSAEGPKQPFRFRKALGGATAETTGHIGALLMLMALSLCVGAVIERAEVMMHVPTSFGSVWSTMGVLVLVLVIIGMTMDPYGAVILVSATLAGIASNAGIHPVHFWMVVLVAFELGYLTPPVALNHLLTRQVVGSEAFEEPVPEGASFWARHERILLPVTVMATALIIVAFLPLTGFGKALWGWLN
jgi:TRAP-type C4-dicarboxylate transport system permease large subunit